MKCVKCGHEIPLTLLKRERFQCPGCGKGYMRKARAKKRGAPKRLKVLLAAVIALLSGAAIWGVVTITTKPAVPIAPAPSNTDSLTETEKRATELFENLPTTEAEGVAVY